jgi:hypothetical protein
MSTLLSARPAAGASAASTTLGALQHRLMSLDEASALIQQGRPCCVAGDENLLRRLPRGCWIGGSIPYFMAEQGGVCTRTQLFVAELPRHNGVHIGGPGDGPRVVRYDRDSLSRVCTDAPEHGFSVMVLPAFSVVHEAFAQEAPGYEDMYLRPLVGWISGTHLDEIGQAKPRVFHGPSGQVLDDMAVVMHVPVAPTLRVHVDIINLFQPGQGARIEFTEGGFAAGDCLIDGQRANLHDWMLATQYDTRWPLVADYCGAAINVSIKRLDAATRRVEFYAPVFAGVPYHGAQPVADYVAGFGQALAAQAAPAEPVFCCNCILNYAYGGLEGQRLPGMHGPTTFGEIGYQLLNQTLVYLSLVQD